MRFTAQPAAEVRWEFYRGHLLEPAQTRQTRTLDVWRALFRWTGDDEDQPLIVLYHDPATQELFVTRQILMHGWETFESSPNVIESRAAQVWRRELVGAIDLSTGADIGAELAHCLELVVVGTSRLPITSLESPLPAFSLGQLAYFPFLAARNPHEPPISDVEELIALGLPLARSQADRARLLEVVLRAATSGEVPTLADLYFTWWQTACQAKSGQPWGDLPSCVRALFNQLALSPYTGLGTRLTAWLECWAGPRRLGSAAVSEVLGYMLRHLVSHLTAFDLITFHNRGANYPDALFLDSLLKAFLRLIEQDPVTILPPASAEEPLLKQARLLRRALRQGWLARQACEGLLVPEVPTSPGENLRVLPAEYPRASDEELQYAVKRRRKLFVDDSLGEAPTGPVSRALAQSAADLKQPGELRELGLGTYLDRPLGFHKAAGETDRTPLLSYVAFSQELAIDRLKQLRRLGLIDNDTFRDHLIAHVRGLPLAGQPVRAYSAHARPGVVALEDARQAAEDFVFLATTRQSLHEFLGHFDWQPLHKADPALLCWLQADRDVLLIREADQDQDRAIVLAVYDGGMSHRATILADMASSVFRQGTELPAEGLRLTTIAGREFRIPTLPVSRL